MSGACFDARGINCANTDISFVECVAMYAMVISIINQSLWIKETFQRDAIHHQLVKPLGPGEQQPYGVMGFCHHSTNDLARHQDIIHVNADL